MQRGNFSINSYTLLNISVGSMCQMHKNITNVEK